jgi:hypothetical protein
MKEKPQFVVGESLSFKNYNLQKRVVLRNDLVLLDVQRDKPPLPPPHD